MENPVFVAYMIAAAIMILKLVGQGWMTVVRMIRSGAGLLNPEVLKPGPANRNPQSRAAGAERLCRAIALHASQ